MNLCDISTCDSYKDESNINQSSSNNTLQVTDESKVNVAMQQPEQP